MRHDNSMKRPWSDFAAVRSQSFVRGLVDDAKHVAPGDLVSIKYYRKEERILACGGHDPIAVTLAYAQEEIIYDADGRQLKADIIEYAKTPREKRLNVFGPAYRADAELWLHKTLADIVVGAAIHLYQSQAWTTVLYDGLRTVDGAFRLYNFATDADIEGGLLALPGESAHNKGLAVDSMMVDSTGCEVDMGGHFDHLDMATNMRTYMGDKISEAAKMNRLVREAAFLRAAFTQGLLVAPLRSEFWDDRLPENREDLWRVLDSAARVMGIELLSDKDMKMRKSDKNAFRKKWESWSYSEFLSTWRYIFAGRENELLQVLGVSSPPAVEKAEFYHGNYHPIYDESLRESGKNLT